MPIEIAPAEQNEPPKSVPLDALHRSFGAKMVLFAGYTMPLQYEGILAEHRKARDSAALFDVSHMGQAWLTGPPGCAAAALERLVPGDVAGLKPWRQRYTLLTNEAGGILDDIMVAHASPDGTRLLLIANASRKQADFSHIAAALPENVRIEPIEDRALLALQGPAAAAVIGRLSQQAAGLPFMGVAEVTLGGAPALVSRSGYTGEDGFEVSVPADAAEPLARRLLDAPEVGPAGLGARDSLRLEAGLCLYGNDIDELTSPVEAGLTWTIGKRRRQAWDFLGALAIRDQLEHGPHRMRVGIRPEGRAPARAGTLMVASDGTGAGTITSGGFSPTLSAPIAMGYVRRDLKDAGTELVLLVRDRKIAATVVPLPFVPHRYVR